MQAFMLYMSGGGVQVFSIGIVFMLLLSPFRNLAGINQGIIPFKFGQGFSIYSFSSSIRSIRAVLE
jgi:hypothetical protein